MWGEPRRLGLAPLAPHGSPLDIGLMWSVAVGASRRFMSEVVKLNEPRSEPAPAEVNFALVLSRMIDSVQQDPAQLRQTVYELARIKLREEFGREDVNEINRLVAALETAIHGVEEFSRNEEGRRAQALPPPEASDASSASGVADELGAADGASTIGARSSRSPSRDATSSRASIGGPAPFGIVLRLLVVGLILLVAAGTFAFWPQLKAGIAGVKDARGPATIAEQPAAPPSKPEAVDKPVPPGPGFPLPTSFGIYALSDGELAELKVLPGKVPDQRVAMSAAISSAGQTVVSRGDVKFIVFRRDAATNAPDNAQVRVIAKVARAMGVDSAGKAVKSQVQDSWVIRNVSFPYKAGPIEGRPEMYLIEAETPDFSLPPGRYALVVKGQGFDFVVDGPVTDPQQCVERVDAVNGVFYSPCPAK